MEPKEEIIINKIIKLIRSGFLAGSFSDGCDCEECDRYESKIKLKLKKILSQKTLKIKKN